MPPKKIFNFILDIPGFSDIILLLIEIASRSLVGFLGAIFVSKELVMDFDGNPFGNDSQETGRFSSGKKASEYLFPSDELLNSLPQFGEFEHCRPVQVRMNMHEAICMFMRICKGTSEATKSKNTSELRALNIVKRVLREAIFDAIGLDLLGVISTVAAELATMSTEHKNTLGAITATAVIGFTSDPCGRPGCKCCEGDIMAYQPKVCSAFPPTMKFPGFRSVMDAVRTMNKVATERGLAAAARRERRRAETGE